MTMTVSEKSSDIHCMAASIKGSRKAGQFKEGVIIMC